MRPRKKVLVYGDDPARLCVICFLLDVRGFAVRSFRAVDELLAAQAEPTERGDAVVVIETSGPERGGGVVAALKKQLGADARVCYVRETQDGLDGNAWQLVYGHADRVIEKRDDRAAYLVEALRVMCERKRGPKPRVVPATAAAPAEVSA